MNQRAEVKCRRKKERKKERIKERKKERKSYVFMNQSTSRRQMMKKE